MAWRLQDSGPDSVAGRLTERQRRREQSRTVHWATGNGLHRSGCRLRSENMKYQRSVRSAGSSVRQQLRKGSFMDLSVRRDR